MDSEIPSDVPQLNKNLKQASNLLKRKLWDNMQQNKKAGQSIPQKLNRSILSNPFIEKK